MLRLKLISSLVMLLVSCFMVCSSAFAYDSFLEPYLSYHTVADSGLTEAKTTFSLTEKPWLYIERATAFDTWDINSIRWYSTSYPSGVVMDFNFDQIEWNSDKTSAWVTFSDDYWYKTLTLSHEGSWSIIANIGSDATAATTTFEVTSSPTVTPEPISSVLFLTGGAALFLRKRRKTVQSR